MPHQCRYDEHSQGSSSLGITEVEGVLLPSVAPYGALHRTNNLPTANAGG